MARTAVAFRELVREALDDLPAEFHDCLDNVEVVVEDWPDPDLLESMDMDPDEDLYGVYLGTPLVERLAYEPELPARIVLFRGPLEEDFPDRRELRRQVAITVLHELAHHLGLDEDRLEELGLD